MALGHTRNWAPALPIRHRSSPRNCAVTRFRAHIVSRHDRFSAVSIMSTASRRLLPDFLADHKRPERQARAGLIDGPSDLLLGVTVW